MEFGFPVVAGSNTETLRLQGWRGVRFDGDHHDEAAGVYREFVSSSSIVSLFRKYNVAADVDYVSIDIDSSDLWVLRALLSSEAYKPKVISVEYNSNFPWGYSLAFPDATDTGLPRRLREWDKDCYLGSSARAIHQVASEFGYVIVDAEAGLDLFLVRSELWGARPLPRLSTKTLYRPFNLQRAHVAMAPDKAAAYIDYHEYSRLTSPPNAMPHRRALRLARRIAATQMARLRDERVPCFVDNDCREDELFLCRRMWASLCPWKPKRGGRVGAWLRYPCHHFLKPEHLSRLDRNLNLTAAF